MALPDNVSQWWSSFVQDFEDRGYSIDNPADRSCIMYFDYVPNNGALAFKSFGDPVERNTPFDAPVMHRKPEEIFASQEPITEEYIERLYTTARENRLYLDDKVNRNPEDPVERESDRICLIGENARTGGAFFSPSFGDLIDYGNSKLSDPNLPQDSSWTTNILRMAHNERLEDMYSPPGGGIRSFIEAYNRSESFITYLVGELEGVRMTRGSEAIKDPDMTDEEYQQFVRDFCGTDPNSLEDNVVYGRYFQYQMNAFDEAHSMRSASRFLSGTNIPETVDKPSGRTPDQHLTDLLGRQDTEKSLTGIFDGNATFYDSDLKVTAVVNSEEFRTRLTTEGIYCLRPERDQMTKLRFDTMTNKLVEEMNPFEEPELVNEPNAFVKGLNWLTTRLFKYELPSVTQYNQYVERKTLFDRASLNVETMRASLADAQIPIAEEVSAEEDSEVQIDRETQRTTEADHSMNGPENTNLISSVNEAASESMTFINNIVEGRSDAAHDMQALKNPDDTRFANVLAQTMLLAEQRTGSTVVKDILNSEGRDGLINLINNTEGVVSLKQNLSAQSLQRFASDRGLSTSKSLLLPQQQTVQRSENVPVRERTDERVL